MSTVIIYRRTATASTFLMKAFDGVYATTPIESVNFNAPCLNVEYECIVERALQNHTGPLTVINLVRNPFSRFVSQFFKNLDNRQIKDPPTGEMVTNPFSVDGDYSYENLERVFRASIRSFLIPNDFGIEKTYPRLFGVEPTAHPFDYRSRCCSFRSDGVRFLTLRQEDSQVWPRHLLLRLGELRAAVRVFRAQRRSRKSNDAASKPYAQAYSEFQRAFRFSDAEKALIEALPTSTHYYADDRGRPLSAR